MLVCDQVITEQGTNKKSLIGIFERIGAPTFPMVLARISVYVKVVDAIGKYKFKLRLVTLKDEKLVAEIDIDAEIKDSRYGSEFALNMGNLPLPEPGKYEFQLYAGDIYLHRVTMEAIQVQMQGGPPWQPQPPQ